MSDKPQQQILTEPENKLPDFTFDQLPPAMRESVEGMGWPAPMPVQAKAIPYLLDKRDMIVQSRTGSGKTGAFMMPLLMRIDPSRRHPQALVLVPTRELAGQVYKEFETLGRGLNLEGALLYGGVGYNSQLQSLRAGAQVIIGTPGRVLDHIGRRALNLDRLNILVFDEADEMLSMGFYPDMRELRKYLPRERSSWMFSATMPYKVQLLAREFLREPEFLSLSSGDVNISTMEHRFYDTPPLEKDLMLMRLIELENPDSVIIFCNTKMEVEYVATVLRNYGYNADQLSGDLDQKSRERAMGRIRRGETRFLVATDVAARGIDISDLSHVIQYDVPKDPDSYVHRAGRTARAGNTGVVITLISNMSEKSDLKKITRRYNIEFVEMPAPTAEEVEQRMAERVTVVLEDRFRAGVTRLQRERMKRFLGLAKGLAESDDESMLLAMLLDNIYQETFHSMPVPAPDAESVAQPEPPAPQQQRQDRQGSRGDRQGDRQGSRDDRGGSREGRQGSRDDRQGSRDDRQGSRDDRQGSRDDRQGSRDDRQGSRDDRPVQPRQEQEEAAGQQEMPERDSRPVPVGAEGEVPQGEGGKKKKKRKRKRNRNRRGTEGEMQGTAEGTAPSGTPEGGEEAPREPRPSGGGQAERRGEKKGGQPKNVPLSSDDQQWLDSIQVIEPESWVSPEGGAKPRETGRPESKGRRGEDESRRSDAERNRERGPRQERPVSAAQPEPRPEPAPAPAEDAPAPEKPSRRKKDAPAPEAPAKEAPAPETPAKEAPAKETPAKKAPSRKPAPAVEEPPAETPAVKGARKGKTAAPETAPAAVDAETAAPAPKKGRATKKAAEEPAAPAAEEPKTPRRAAKKAAGEPAPEPVAEKKGRATKKAAEEPAAPVAEKKGRAPKKTSSDEEPAPSRRKKTS